MVSKKKQRESYIRNLEKLGITIRDGYASSIRREPMIVIEGIKGVEKQLRISGINALGPIHQGHHTIVDILTKEGTVDVLISDFCCDEFNTREEIEKSVWGRLRAEWLASVLGLFECYEKANRKGKLTVRCYKTKPTEAIVIIDRWLLQYNPYDDEMAKQNLVKTVQLYFIEQEDSGEDAIRNFNKYEGKFNTMWEESREREIDFKKGNGNEIKEKLEKMKTLLYYKRSQNL